MKLVWTRGFGSSPRVRGTPPACAARRSISSVHPRVCGEHLGDIGLHGIAAGSSPRVRGTLPSGGLRPSRSRFIPACAGNTSNAVATATAEAVHPRVCGEHGGFFRFAVLANRFIPACAGNTANAALEVISEAVHPRVCGEHLARRYCSATSCGSSPRVRGTLGRESVNRAASRFIPACAGNTMYLAMLLLQETVHPRVCGEHAGEDGDASPFSGSSPRVRGTRRLRSGTSSPARFIPACAGNTASRPR